MRIAYVTSRFPHLNTTFVLDEMLGVEALRHELSIFVTRPPIYREEELHARYRDLVARIYTPRWIWSVPILAANLRWLFRHPIRYAATWMGLVIESRFHPMASAKALAVFPKSVWFSDVVERENIDWIHAHFASLPTTAAWIVSRLTDVPFSFTSHAFDVFERSFRVSNPMLATKVKAARFVVTSGSASKEFLVEKVGKDFESKIHVIHLGVRTDTFRRGSEPRPAEPRPFHIVSVGTFIEKKGHDYLIEACGVLKRRGVPFQCSIIGPGERTRYDRLVAREQLQDVVELLPSMPQERLLPTLARADVFVLACVITASGDRDGIPTALMEALALECPVITTSVSSIPDLVQNQRTGLLVPPRDATAIAAAVERLIGDPELRSELGRCGRELVVRRFDARKNAERLANRIQASFDASHAHLA